MVIPVACPEIDHNCPEENVCSERSSAQNSTIEKN
jgi:hypothetical protein